MGAAVTDAMGALDPMGSSASTRICSCRDWGTQGPSRRTARRRTAAAEQGATFRATGFGYFLEQTTRPQTIGYALLDSPVALAAWMLDHDTDSYYKIASAFVEGKPSAPGSHLDNITTYWLTATGASAAVYWRAGRHRLARPDRLRHRSRSRSDSPSSRVRSYGPRGAGSILPDAQLLQQGRQGRSLRRLGGAGALHGGDPRGIQIVALTAVQRDHRGPQRLRRLTQFLLVPRPPDLAPKRKGRASSAATRSMPPSTPSNSPLGERTPTWRTSLSSIASITSAPAASAPTVVSCSDTTSPTGASTDIPSATTRSRRSPSVTIRSPRSPPERSSS